MKRIMKFIRENIFILVSIIIFILFCVYSKNHFSYQIMRIDEKVQTFFIEKMINPSNNELMKNVTLLGSTFGIIGVFLFSLIIFRNRIKSILLTLNLGFIGILTFILKNSFKRIRPVSSIITNPTSFSFPSGHTLFAVGFYGLIIYFIWQTHAPKFTKYLLTFIISMVIIFIGISRIYLNVHYFSDVIGGAVLGILSVILFINIYRNWSVVK